MRRRGKGEGSISLRKDGRWMGRVDLGWRDGKRCSKAVYGTTRRKAAEALTKALLAAQQGMLLPDERQQLPNF